jgi:hypothetical protein
LEGKIGKVLFYCINKEAPGDILAQGGILRWKWRFCNKSSRYQSNNWDEVPHTPVVLAFNTFEDIKHALNMTDTMWIERLQIKSTGDEIEFTIDLEMRHLGIIHNLKMCDIMEVKRCGIYMGY